jgi:solute:Na+ symporter, SSS family
VSSPYGIHWADIAVIVAYLAVIVVVGMRAAAAKTEEGFFLAGRKLGKFFQFFLNFGNACDANGAVSTASVVYQQGISGIWISFQTVFMNPYYWFMATWFRRARLVTNGDLFEDRFDSKALASFYAVYQTGVAIILIAFGNFVGYKVTSALLGYEIGPLPFYILYTAVVAVYIVSGGLAAAAVNQALQGTLIVLFSSLLIPSGLHAAGGWHDLARKIPAGMLDLFGGTARSQFTGWSVVAVVFVSLIQMHSVLSQMTILGSARNEFAARFGMTSGTYAKRVMIILWAFVGLIAIALFAGPSKLPDPDTVWGATSKLLLGPGVRGLMVAGILAADMSSLGAQTVTVAGMFVRNLYGHSHPDRSAADSVGAARVAMIGVLTLSILVATLMSNLKAIMLLILYGNVGFGAAIFMLFHWRRLTAAAVWWCVTSSLLVSVVVPFGAQLVPSLRSCPELVQMSTRAEDAMGAPAPLYFDSIGPTVSDGPNAVPAGRGRFNFELYLLKCAGLQVTKLSAGGILAAQLFFDGLFPFAILIGMSWLTSGAAANRVKSFYGKMKTPVGATPELERHAIEETMRNPSRFDHLKLFPQSQWEFCRWDREDALGFATCCGVSGAILGSFWLLLRALA